jgi:hypothetical protein
MRVYRRLSRDGEWPFWAVRTGKVPIDENWWTKRERYEEFWRCILIPELLNFNLSKGWVFEHASCICLWRTHKLMILIVQGRHLRKRLRLAEEKVVS